MSTSVALNLPPFVKSLGDDQDTIFYGSEHMGIFEFFDNFPGAGGWPPKGTLQILLPKKPRPELLSEMIPTARVIQRKRP